MPRRGDMPGSRSLLGGIILGPLSMRAHVHADVTERRGIYATFIPTFYVRHPKGEGSYASAQDVRLIRGDMKDYVITFLRDRNEYLAEAGLSSDYLFLNLKTRFPLTSNSIRRYKDELAAKAGVNFRLKDFRSTLASMVIKGDVTRMKAASCQLRHSSIKTTERYYAAIERGKIIDDIVDVWKEDPVR